MIRISLQRRLQRKDHLYLRYTIKMTRRRSTSSSSSGGLGRNHRNRFEYDHCHQTSFSGRGAYPNFYGNTLLEEFGAYFDINGGRHSMPSLEVEYDANRSRKTNTVNVIYPFGQQSTCRVVYDTMTYLRSSDESKVWFLLLYYQRSQASSWGNSIGIWKDMH